MTNHATLAQVFKVDINRLASAHRLASAVQAGYVWINDVEKRWIGVPWGGQKDSGTGTEYSIEELYSYTQNKTVSVNLG